MGLGVPTRVFRPDLNIALFILGSFWLVGAAPSIHWLDTAELSLASFSLGIGHPPGQPIDALVGNLGQLLPLGSLGFRKTLISILAMLSAVGGVSLWVRAVGSSGAKNSWRYKEILGGLILCSVGFSGLVSFQAIRPELYALVGGLTLLAVALGSREDDRRFVYLAWFCWGFAAVIHPLISVMALPFLLRPGWKIGLAFSSAAALSLLYLPLRASQWPLWNFGAPDSWSQFLWFVRGDLYKAYDSPELGSLAGNLLKMGDLLVQNLTLLGALLALVGVLACLAFHRAMGIRLLVALVWSTGSLAAMGNFWPTNPDVGGYLTPILLLLGGALILAGNRYLDHFPLWGKRVLVGLVVGWTGYQAVHYLESYRLTHDWSAHRHSVMLLGEPAIATSLHTASFSTYSLVRYAQVVEGRRPDVSVFYRGLANTGRSQAVENPLTDHMSWELAIRRNEHGKYSLRNEDLSLTLQLVPQGWFCAVSGRASPGFADDLRQRTRLVQEDMVIKRNFQQEPLILNYLLHILLARRQADVDREERLLADAKILFHEFDDYSRLESFK